MRTRNLALSDRDQCSRQQSQSLRACELSDRELLDAIDQARQNEDLGSLELLCDEAGNRCE